MNIDETRTGATITKAKKGKKERAWKRYYDSEQQAYYWYNQVTGQSRWEEDDFDYSSTSLVQNPLAKQSLSSTSLMQSHDTEDADLPLPSSNMQALEVESPAPPATQYPHSSSNKKKTKKKGKKKNELSTATVEEEDDENDAGFDILCYTRFSRCNAVIFEAPMCILEAVTRILILGIVALLWIFYYVAILRKTDKYVWNILKRIVRDILLTCAGALSLALPGMIWYIYRHHKSLNSWYLTHIPTIIGPVDPRRFVIISVFGMGSMASNATVDLADLSNDCLDVWKESCFYYPRNVIGDLRGFLNGRRSMESLETALASDEI